MKRHIIRIILIMLLPCRALTQAVVPIQSLQINDRIPNLTIDYRLAGIKGQGKLEEFRGKLLIIDFWNIWCSSCVAAMPKLDALQKEYKGKIQIILVTKNTEQEADALFQRIGLKVSEIPMIYGDKELNQIFPHQGEPFHVWVDGTGIVRHQTAGYNANKENIELYLKGKALSLSKMSGSQDYDSRKSLLEEVANRSRNKVVYSSILAKNMNEVSGGTGLYIAKDSASGKIYRINLVNQPIINMFQVAYHKDLLPIWAGRLDLVREGRISIEVTDPYFLNPPSQDFKKDNWIKSHLLSYELAIPKNRSDEVFDFMKQDINKLLDYKGSIEKRRKLCLVLIRIDTEDRLKTKNPTVAGETIYRKNTYELKNEPFTVFLKDLEMANYNLQTPLIDETNYQGNVDIILNGKLKDIAAIRKELRPYGLDLITVERDVDILVVKDR